MKAHLDNFYRELDPTEALTAGDGRYVNCHFSRAEHILEKLFVQLQRQQPRSRYMISGHKGTGKTTEINCLCKRIEDSNLGYCIINCDVADYINLNDVQTPDIMFAIVNAVYLALKGKGIDVQTPKLERLIKELITVLKTDITITKFELPVLLGKMQVDLKNVPNMRQIVDAHLRPKAADLLDAVNELLVKAQALLLKGSGGKYHRILLICESLDRILLTSSSSSSYNSHEAIFIRDYQMFSELDCDWLLTLPPELLLSRYATSIKTIYAIEPVMIPCIPVKRVKGGEDTGGLVLLKEILEKRARKNGLSLLDLFESDDAIKALCYSSGGFVRGLLSLTRQALSYAKHGKVLMSHVRSALKDARDGYLTAIRDEVMWERLCYIHTHKRIGDGESELRLLSAAIVYHYYDEEHGPWYDLSPVILETNQFKEAFNKWNSQIVAKKN